MKRAVVVLLAFGLSFPHMSAGAETAGITWPKSPFVPHLIHVSPGSEKLCARFEHEAVTRYFDGFYSPDTVPQELVEMPVIEAISLSKLSSLKYAGFSSRIYLGDWDGDGLTEYIFALRTGGGNVTNYRYYHQFVELTSERLQTLRDDLKAIAVDADGTPYQEIHRLFLALQKELTLAARPRSRRSVPVGRAADAVEQAYSLVDSMRVRSHKGRLYADVLVPDAEKTDRVLLSYDAEMRPRAACVVAVKGEAEDLPEYPFSGGALASLLSAYEHTMGSPESCPSGSSNPFLYGIWTKALILHDAVFRPWKAFGDVNSPLNEEKFHDKFYSDEIKKGQGHWIYNPHQYYWSLEGAFNRRAFNRFQLRSTDGVRQLAEFYAAEYDVDGSIASRWAGLYVHALRRVSSSSGDYYFGYRHDATELKRIVNGEATANDYIHIASLQHDWRYERLMSQDANEPTQAVYDKALSLAVGAGASVEVLQTLIDQGATADGGDEPSLLNAVDNLKALDLLLRSQVKPDARNGFGKTALMMAAHMNQIEAVHLLLEMKANPNLKTWRDLPKVNEDRRGELQPDCRYTRVKYRERTPLMYAAENASLEVLKLLVDAGGDTQAVDTRGRSVFDYLAMNRLLTAEELGQAKQMLAGP